MLSPDELKKAETVFREAMIIPVAAFDDEGKAMKTAELLVRNGMKVLEITLRTESALKIIAAIAKRFPDLYMGAGSVLSADAMRRAIEAGARFGVAPCLDVETFKTAKQAGIPFMPGIATPTELHQALQCGAYFVKLFPAAELGGVAYIKAITAPFRTQRFHLIPTGGISEKNFAEFLKADRVLACGATYLVSPALVDEGNFAEIEARIVKFMELRASLL